MSLSAAARVRQKQSEKSSHPEVPACRTLTALPLGSDNFRHLFAHLHPDNCHPQDCPRVCLSSPLFCLSRQLSLPTPPTPLPYHGSSSTTSSMTPPPFCCPSQEGEEGPPVVIVAQTGQTLSQSLDSLPREPLQTPMCPPIPHIPTPPPPLRVL